MKSLETRTFSLFATESTRVERASERAGGNEKRASRAALGIELEKQSLDSSAGGGGGRRPAFAGQAAERARDGRLGGGRSS